MSKNEIVLLSGDSIDGPTGFANNLAGVAWSLAKDYDVHILGLQTRQNQKVKINLEGEEREVIQHANYPRSNERFDFGAKSLPYLLEQLDPDIYLTVNDIQMVSHVPGIMRPSQINMNIADPITGKVAGDYALQEMLEGELMKYKENFPRKAKWIQLAPHDGTPPMPDWARIYKTADKCIAMTRYGQSVFKQYYDMDVPVIYHGVDCETFKNQEKPDELKDKFVIGSIHRNQPRKQPVRMIEAFSKFAKDKDDVFLHMQMDWRDMFGWPLDYFANLYGVGNKMIRPFPVGMNRKEVANVYNMWDINTQATAGEGFGIPEIEGFAAGLPCLSTDYTTGRELTLEGEPGPRGELIKVKDLFWDKMDVAAVQRALVDTDHFAELMNKYYYNRDLMIEHGKNARTWVEKNCSWKVVEKDWQKLIEDTLSS